MLESSQSPPNSSLQVLCCQLQKPVNLVNHQLILACSGLCKCFIWANRNPILAARCAAVSYRNMMKHVNLVHHRLILARSCHRTCLNRANHHLILPPGALLSATKTCKSCKPQANSGLQLPPYMLKLSQSAANSGLQVRCCQMRKHSKTSFRCPPSQVLVVIVCLVTVCCSSFF